MASSPLHPRRLRAAAALALLLLAGCSHRVEVAAPARPIEIDVTLTIRYEVAAAPRPGATP